MVLARRVLLVAVIAGLLIGGWRLADENSTPVVISYGLGVSAEIPLWTAMLAAFAVGAGLVAIYSVYRAIRAGLVARRYRTALHGLEAEVHQLRNLPLGADDRMHELEVPDAEGRDALKTPKTPKTPVG
jgi:TRAP-type C4-dicarboxylate transport system permease small subunit